MNLPLYKNNQAPPTCPKEGHAGLWFERFFDQYTDKWEISDQKAVWLKDHFSNRRMGETPLLEKKVLQQMALTNALKGKSQVFKAAGYFVTGMGNAHPVENGFSWHPTLGLPYLTGSAVKGLVHHWLEVWEDPDKERLLKWFGNASDPDYPIASGELIFFDALPIEIATLKVDIMTPHMGNWYAQGDKIENIEKDSDKIPADWHNPVPIPFLVTDNLKLLFSFAPRTQQSNIDLDKVLDVLTNALDYLGAGAKTAAGYGQMEEDTQNTDYLSKILIKTATNLSDIERQLVEVAEMIEKEHCQHGGKIGLKIGNLLGQSTDWNNTDKHQLADLMGQFYDKAGWGKGKKKTQRKNTIKTLRGEC